MGSERFIYREQLLKDMDRLCAFSDYVIRCPKTYPTVQWWQLVPTNTVKIDKNDRAQIFKKALDMSGTYTNLAKKLGVSRKAVSQWHTGRNELSVFSLKKLLKFVGIPLDEFNKKILELGSIRRPKIPFNLKNQEGAEIIAAFLSDGHIPKQNTKNPMYCANEHELHERLISICEEVFGEFDSQIKMGHGSLLTRFPCPIGTALELAGVPRRDKRRKNPYLPRHILKAGEYMQTAYLRRVFDDEGDVCNSQIKRAVRRTRSTDAGESPLNPKVRKERWTYGIENSCMNNLILGECLLLRKIGIDARLYPEGVYHSKNGRMTVKWRIQVAQQDNIRLFSQKIGFNYSVKRKKLETMISSYRKKKGPDGRTEKLVWNYILRTSKKQKETPRKNVCNFLGALGFTHDFASTFLKKFSEQGKIQKIRRGVYIVKHYS